MKLFKILVILTAIIALVGLIGCGEKDKPAKKEEPAVTEAVTVAAVAYTPTEADYGTEIKCTACGMKMTVAEGMPAATYKNENYYFCNADEQAAFLAHADIMINQSQAVDSTQAEDHSGHDHSGN